MEKATSFQPVTVKKKVYEIVTFHNIMSEPKRGWMYANPDNANTPLGKKFQEIFPQLLTAQIPLNNLKTKKDNDIEAINEKYADCIKESRYLNEKGQSVIEYEFRKKEVVKRNWWGKLISTTVINPREQKRKEIADYESQYAEQQDILMKQEVDITPCYVANKDVPKAQILPTQMLPLFKGFIIDPDWDANGIIRDLK